jgi:hypothetical protein
LITCKLNNGQTGTELCEYLDMSRQVVTKHLGVLETSKPRSDRRRGRETLRYLNPLPLQEIYERDQLMFR